MFVLKCGRPLLKNGRTKAFASAVPLECVELEQRLWEVGYTMFCRCPVCKKLMGVKSKDFGNEFLCPNCHHVVVLDVEHLAHFSLPSSIHIQLVDADHLPHKVAGIPVVANYGYRIGPILTDNNGTVVFTKSLFEIAEKDEIDSGLMDHKGKYSLGRYIDVSFSSSRTRIDLEGAPDSLRISLSLARRDMEE